MDQLKRNKSRTLAGGGLVEDRRLHGQRVDILFESHGYEAVGDGDESDGR